MTYLLVRHKNKDYETWKKVLKRLENSPNLKI